MPDKTCIDYLTRSLVCPHLSTLTLISIAYLKPPVYNVKVYYITGIFYPDMIIYGIPVCLLYKCIWEERRSLKIKYY
jgi:hypothetical protein